MLLNQVVSTPTPLAHPRTFPSRRLLLFLSFTAFFALIFLKDFPSPCSPVCSQYFSTWNVVDGNPARLYLAPAPAIFPVIHHLHLHFYSVLSRSYLFEFVSTSEPQNWRAKGTVSFFLGRYEDFLVLKMTDLRFYNCKWRYGRLQMYISWWRYISTVNSDEY